MIETYKLYFIIPQSTKFYETVLRYAYYTLIHDRQDHEYEWLYINVTDFF